MLPCRGGIGTNPALSEHVLINGNIQLERSDGVLIQNLGQNFGFEGQFLEVLHARFQRNEGIGRAEQEAILKGEVRRRHIILPARLIEEIHVRADVQVGTAIGHEQDFRHPGVAAMCVDDGEVGKVRRNLVDDHGMAVAGVRTVAAPSHEQERDALCFTFLIMG